MHLNTLSPGKGAKKSIKRLGRGIGSGLGKTSGKGHKGQHARAGGYHKLGFEGGQMPMQRRLPKFGFTPINKEQIVVLTLRDLNRFAEKNVSLESLKKANVIKNYVEVVKIIKTGELTDAFHLKGLKVSEGAKQAILEKGGSVE
ncbi:MAG: 50S ribosomal protein L15 [Gammaproteobacteria bacterium]